MRFVLVALFGCVLATLHAKELRAECYNAAERPIPCSKNQQGDGDDSRLPRQLRTAPTEAVLFAMYCDAANSVLKAQKNRSLRDQELLITYSFKQAKSNTTTASAGIGGILLQPFTLSVSGNISRTQALDEDATLGKTPTAKTAGFLADTYCTVQGKVRGPNKSGWLYNSITKYVLLMENPAKGNPALFAQQLTFSKTVRVSDEIGGGAGIKFLGLFDISTRSQTQLATAHTMTITADIKPPVVAKWYDACQPYCAFPTKVTPTTLDPPAEYQPMKVSKDHAIGLCAKDSYATATITPDAIGTYILRCHNRAAISPVNAAAN